MASNLAVKELNYDDINTQELELNNIYHFSLFEPIDEKVKKEKETKKENKRIEKTAKIEKANYLGKIIRIFATFSTFVILFSVMLGLNARCDEIATQITKLESEISIAESENTRLQSLLESKTAVGELREYAMNVLGMVKVENYKITYLQRDEQNEVVLSGGKSYDDTIWDRIKKTFT